MLRYRESSLALAVLFPDHYVIGVDQSAARLRRRLAMQNGGGQLPPSVGFARADLVDYWRLLHDEGIRLVRHYLLYRTLGPRSAISPAAGTAIGVPAVAELGGVLECRSNWRMHRVLPCPSGVLIGRERARPFVPDSPLTFERKYAASGHALYRAVVDLRS